MEYIRTITTCFLWIISAGTVFAQSEPVLRVAVISQAKQVVIESANSTPLTALSSDGREIAKYNKHTLLIDSRMVGNSELIIKNEVSSYKIGQKYFSGSLRVVKHDGQLTIINDVPLETYLTGLINSEISSSWPEEAIKAQAVAARTYAINQMKKTRSARPDATYDIESTIMGQVYEGAHLEDAKSQKNVMATRGEVLKRNGAIFPAFFHSCCGGMTEHAHNVWNDADGPDTVLDRFCERSPKKNWQLTIPHRELRNLLAKNGINIGNISSVIAVPLIDSPRIEAIIIESSSGIENIKATELRRMIGFTKFKSTWFEVKNTGGNLLFEGHGYGHGVGMCQWGAKGMAEEGYKYTDILKFYYNDAELVGIY